MVRFDIVVANMNRAEVFWESFENIKAFDPMRDRIIIMDCSHESSPELEKSLAFLEKAGSEDIKLLFYKRRNWCMNHGAQLDYLRLLFDGELIKPQFVFFMQDHYLNKKKFVKGDSIPDDCVIDLDVIEEYLQKDNESVIFCARNGFRVSTSVPINLAEGDNARHYQSARDICFVIDGGNFCLNPDWFSNYYLTDKGRYFEGNGSYMFAHVWETRLCKILYDQNLTFHELSSGLKYRKIEEMKASFPDPCNVWSYFYHFPAAYFLYGRDIFEYNFRFSLQALTASVDFFRQNMFGGKNTVVQRIFPS